MSKVGKVVWFFNPTGVDFDGQPLAGMVTRELPGGWVGLVVFSRNGETTAPWQVELVTGARAVGEGAYAMWPEGSSEALGEQMQAAVTRSEVERLSRRVGEVGAEARALEEGVDAARAGGES